MPVVLHRLADGVPARKHELDMHCLLFCGAVVCVPFVGMVYTGVRALFEPIKFSLSWIPLLLVLYVGMSAICFGLSLGLACLLRWHVRFDGRSPWLTGAWGLLLGLASVFPPNVPVPWAFAVVVGGGLALFREREARVQSGPAS